MSLIRLLPVVTPELQMVLMVVLDSVVVPEAVVKVDPVLVLQVLMELF